jgi:hypothetical protein
MSCFAPPGRSRGAGVLRPARRLGRAPVAVVTDRASVYPHVVDELVPSARHGVEQCATDENVNRGASRVFVLCRFLARCSCLRPTARSRGQDTPRR